MDKLNIDRRSVTPIVDAMQYDAGRQAEFTLTEDMTNTLSIVLKSVKIEL